MTRKQRFEGVLTYFRQHIPNAETELLYDNPFQLLVAVILSAQCTDKRVNLTTPAIFAQYPTPEAMANATFEELFPLIKSISYPNNKTKHLIGILYRQIWYILLTTGLFYMAATLAQQDHRSAKTADYRAFAGTTSNN